MGTGSAAAQKQRRNDMMTFLDGAQTTNKKYNYLNIILYKFICIDLFIDYCEFITRRTTTNIHNEMIDDIDSVEFIDESSIDSISDISIEPISKRPRKNSNEKIKLFESVANDLKENQNKKMEILHQFVQPKTELELFFASLCKTVEKFSPLEQAKVKISVSRIVSETEISNLENAMKLQENTLLSQQNLLDGETFSIEELPICLG